MSTVTAKRLIITAKDINGDIQEQEKATPYSFPVWEFENGSILVPSESTNDYFFESREKIKPSGIAAVIGIEETSITTEWGIEDLRLTIQASENEFGPDTATAKIKELVK